MLSAHFDLLDRSHERVLHLVTAGSTVKWTNLEPVIQVYESAAKAWKRHPQPENYNYESCYHDEIGHFLKCIEKREPWPIALGAAEEIVRLLQALDVSDRERRAVALTQEGS